MNNKKTVPSNHVSIIEVRNDYSFFTSLELSNMKQAWDSPIPFLSSCLFFLWSFLCGLPAIGKSFNDLLLRCLIQGESLARGPKLLSIENYVIEIMIGKFMYIYRKRCETGSTHNRCWNWSPFISKHNGMRFSKFWNIFPKVSTLTAWISWRIVSLSCLIVRGVFLYTLPFNRPQRKKSAGVRSASPCL